MILKGNQRAGGTQLVAHLLKTVEEHQRLKLELLRQEVRKGLDEVERGNVLSAEQAVAELDKELAG